MMASSRVRTPAAYDAAISPLEWPTTADGVTCQVAKILTRTICSAVQIGCEYSALARISLSSEYLRTSASI